MAHERYKDEKIGDYEVPRHVFIIAEFTKKRNPSFEAE